MLPAVSREVAQVASSGPCGSMSERADAVALGVEQEAPAMALAHACMHAPHASPMHGHSPRLQSRRWLPLWTMHAQTGERCIAVLSTTCPSVAVGELTPTSMHASTCTMPLISPHHHMWSLCDFLGFLAGR